MEPQKAADTAKKGGEEAKETPAPKVWDTIEAVGVESQKDPELRKEYDNLIKEKGPGEGEREFLRLHLNPKEYEKFFSEEEPGSAEPQPGSEPPKKEDEILTFQIPKKDLLEAGITATDPKGVLDSIAKQSRYIESLTKETIPGLERQRDELKAAQGKLDAAAADLDKVLKDAPLPDELKIDDLPDELYTPEDQVKLKEKLKTFADSLNKVVSRQKAYETARKTAAEEAGPKAEPTAPLDPEAARKKELTEVDQLRAANPTLFKVGRPMEKIEDQYHNFMFKLGEATGTKVYDENGQWTEDLKKQFDLYVDEEKGKDLKAKLDAAGIGLPDDFDDIILCHDLREIRRKNFEPDGVGADGKVQFKPWSYEKALDYYVKSHAPEDPKMEQARKAKEITDKVVADRKEKAPEFKPGGKKPVSVPEVQREFQGRYADYLKDPTPDKKKWLEDAMKTFNMPQKEIDSALTIQPKV